MTELTPIDPGGRASDDAIRSLVISYKLLGTSEWFIIHHTNCGMEFFTDSVMSIDQKFVLDTTTMSESDLSALGMQRSDVLYDGNIGIYDHLPLVTDFVVHTVPKNR